MSKLSRIRIFSLGILYVAPVQSYVSVLPKQSDSVTRVMSGWRKREKEKEEIT